MDDPTSAELLMAEITANLEALTEHAMEQIQQPPRGPIREVGHFRALNEAKLKRKELDALQLLLDELAYNVAATIFATLDGSIESDIPDFPKFALVDQSTGTTVASSLHEAFSSAWEEDDTPDK